MRHTSRVFAHVHGESVQKRTPALINLPIPLPSIPILSPILSPIINGAQPPSPPAPQPQPEPQTQPQPEQPNNPSPPSTPTQVPPSTPFPTSDPSPNNPGNDKPGGNNPGGNSPGNPSPTGPSDPPQNTTPPSNPPSSDNPPSSNPGNNNGGGAKNNGPLPPSSSGPDPTGSPHPSSDGSSPTPSTNGEGNGGDPFHMGSPANFVGGTSDGSEGNSNEGGVRGGGQGAASGAAGNKPIATSGIGPGGGNGGNIIGGTGEGGSSDPAGHGGKGGLSAGAIAAIGIISALAIILLVLFLIRRRHKSRVAQRRNQWWRGYSNNHLPEGLSSSPSPSPLARNNSFRSSFCTTIDHGAAAESPRFSWMLSPAPDLPAFPPMAEVRQGQSATYASPLISVHTPGTPRPSSQEISNQAGAPGSNSRFSIGSFSSTSSTSSSSDSGGQYLLASGQTHSAGSPSPGPPTPMSVRPFSPSESFAFPKPPRASVATASELGMTTRPPSQVPLSTYDNPFADPASAQQPDFAERETIKRPFLPTLDDEMGVVCGDVVHVIKSYDDGWALVQKFDGSKNVVIDKGLIPIDCLRDANVELPAFLAAKRVSSYRGNLQISF